MYDDIIKCLKNNKDLKYKEFNDKIVNTKLKTIGVRTPILKDISKKILKQVNSDYLDKVGNIYYEEILIEGFIISYIKDINVFLNKIDIFLDKIDNWAICDLVNASCKIFDKYKEEGLEFIRKNIKSNNMWRVRFAFVTLLNYYIYEKYLDLIFNYVNKDKNDDYYVMMSKAWLISICYIKYPNKTLEYMKNTKIDNKLYNTIIQKICDSKRVLKKDKLLLKLMKKK